MGFYNNIGLLNSFDSFTSWGRNTFPAFSNIFSGWSNRFSLFGNIFRPASYTPLYSSSWGSRLGWGASASISPYTYRPKTFWSLRGSSSSSSSDGTSMYARFKEYVASPFNRRTTSASASTPIFLSATASRGTSTNYSRASQAAAQTYKPAKVSSDFKKRVKALGPEFLAKVKRVAKNINCDYKDLLAVMNAESGLNHTIQNQAGHHYYGLIQFGEDAAKSIGTTTEKLVRMSAIEQLDYVEKYYLQARKTRGFGNQKLSAGDLYALTLAPAHAKSNVMYSLRANPKQYKANKPIDTHYGNGDGVITKNELNNYMNTRRVDETLFVA